MNPDESQQSFSGSLMSAEATAKIPQEFLRSLLLKPVYRDKWSRYVQRRRGDSINQRAVATFIAYELSDYSGQDIDPATIKDRVSRALNGDTLSGSTAHMFATAFGFTAEEERELSRTIALANLHKKLTANSGKVLEASESPYTAISTSMEAFVDAFGYIKYFHYTEVIISESDELTEIASRFESPTSTVTLLEGGTVHKISPYDRIPLNDPANDVWQTVVRTPYPIRRGQIHRLKYRIDLDLVSEIETTDSAFNNALMGPYNIGKFNLCLMIHFDEAPQEIRQKFWAGAKSPETLIEDIVLQPQTYVSMSFPYLHDAAFSFAWSVRKQEALEHYRDLIAQATPGVPLHLDLVTGATEPRPIDTPGPVETKGDLFFSQTSPDPSDSAPPSLPPSRKNHSPEDQANQFTSTFLRAELLEPGPRAIWEPYLHQERLKESNPFSIRAIARAMSAYQEDTYGLHISPSVYKDRVWRAITGQGMSQDTLELFCKTFEFSPETTISLYRALSGNTDDGMSLTYLANQPQAMAMSAFADIQLTADGSPITLKLGIILLALEAGCSILHLILPGAQEVTVPEGNFTVSHVPAEESWVFIPDSFYNPMQNFALEMVAHTVPQLDDDGFYSIIFPLPPRSFSLGVRCTTGGETMTIAYSDVPYSPSVKPTVSAQATVTDSYSHLAPMLGGTTLHIRWKPEESKA
ncbi:hypothetical protein [Rothia nasimurium]|uniref:hypothetical protein n=1 Tax=Rothia nasimurium TaxID=85336 RepID=UPI001F36403C|nr:hypothetical protein [Rothia nasimurium]